MNGHDFGKYSSSSLVYSRAPGVACVDGSQEDRLTLLNLETDQPVVLTGTAVKIWKLVDSERNIQEIVDYLHQEFENDSTSIDGQVQNFLGMLDQSGLIQSAF